MQKKKEFLWYRSGNQMNVLTSIKKQAQKCNDELAVFDELLIYFKNHILLIVAVYIIAIGVWGSWLSKDIVTFDEEGLYSLDGQAGWYNQWFVLGRWFFVILKKIMHVYSINPYFSKAIFLIGFPLIPLLWLFCMEQWSGKCNLLSELIFCLIFISHPIWATHFSYRIQMEVMIVSMLALVVGVHLVVRWLKTNNWFLCIAALTIVTCCFGSYQSLMFFYADAIAIWLFLDGICDGKTDFKKLRNRLLKITLFTIAAFLLWRTIAIKMGYRPEDPYIAEQFRWGKDSARVCATRVVRYIKDAVLGNGDVYSSIYGIVSALFIGQLFYRVFMKKAGTIWSLFTGMVIIITPFLLEILTAGAIVIRSQLSFVYSCAFMAAYS